MLKRLVTAVAFVFALGATSGLAQAQPAPPVICSLQAADEAYDAGRYADAVAMWRPCAEQGNADAQYILGVMYERGDGVPRDYVEAVRLYRLAAEQGHANAQTALGTMYFTGDGVPQDDVEAVRLYRLAAEQGHANAQFNLGNMYRYGYGVPQDYVLAHMWFNIASANGTDGQYQRDAVAILMTPQQIAEAQRLAREWVAAHLN